MTPGLALALLSSAGATAIAAPVAAAPVATTASTPADPAEPDDDPPPPIDPDPRAVAEAREANFAPTSVREGFAIGISVGPALQIGYGVTESSGFGGGFDLRLGTVASPRWVWLFELAGTTYENKKSGRINQSGVFTVGGQLYIEDALWLRGGVGFATFSRRLPDGDREVERLGGLGGVGAGGIDLFRRGGLALSFEVMGSVAFYDSGTVFGTSLQLGLSWY